MKLGPTEVQQVLTIVHTPGFKALMDILDEKMVGLSKELSYPKENLQEDIRLLQLWRGYVSAKQYLTELPQELLKESREHEQKIEALLPQQQILFGGFDESFFNQPTLKTQDYPVRTFPQGPSSLFQNNLL